MSVIVPSRSARGCARSARPKTSSSHGLSDDVAPGDVSGDVPGLPISPSGGLLHEVFAASPSDFAAAAGFTTAAMLCVVEGRPIVWIRQEELALEAGRLHPPGLVEFGLGPRSVVLVRTRNASATLAAGDEAARCAGLGAVVMELWGESARVDLTATRRLSLGAERSGAAVFMLRAAAGASPSAAFTRWSVRALPSRGLAANAPGMPSFTVALLKHRGGAAPKEWDVEWDRDRGCFAATLPGRVVSVPARRQMGAGDRSLRNVG